VDGDRDDSGRQAQPESGHLPQGDPQPGGARRREGPGFLRPGVRRGRANADPGPGGTIVHPEIQIGDSVVIVEDEDPQRGTAAPPAGGLPGTPVFQFIYVADVDAVWRGPSSSVPP
jgi:hypothetical protein